MNKEDQKRLLREMIFYRRFEDRTFEAYMERKIGGFLHLYSGQEAVATGVLEKAVVGQGEKNDYVITGYRDHIHAIKTGAPAREVMAELYGKETGSSKGRGGSMHIFDASQNFMGGYALVGQPFPLAAGLALGAKHKGSGQIAICFLGDGANNQGTFHETMNMASVWNLPVLFVCENNQYAIGTEISRSTAQKDQYKRVDTAYNMKSSQHDGMDIDIVMAEAEKAVNYVRKESKPYFIEFMTYRFRGHSMSDAKGYRTRDEELEWEKRDPIRIYSQRLIDAGVLTADDIKAMEKEIDNEIENDIVKFAEESPEPKVEELDRYVLDDNPDPRWIGPLQQ
ncbi:MAG: pyruvate dehydrogenase (acetyl-transferring) E1 component subunit alpha [Gammaproteobacteria bacterium]|nr:pyruvate dehydrogenase (acetyl-transferring) E1 component subunit alpha [Gammaproteobacteria bacterium]